jgi:hypothetical protein
LPGDREMVRLRSMKQILLAVVVMALAGCGKKESAEPQESSRKISTSTSWVSDSTDLNNVKIETAIRAILAKPEGELTKADLDKVKVLVITGQELSSLENLEKLTKLEKLNVFNNNLSDANGLEKLKQLQQLNLGINLLSDVKALGKLKQLLVLNLSNNPNITRSQITELQKALPNCRIGHSATR